MVKLTFGSRAAEAAPRNTTSSSSFQVSEDIMPIAELKSHLSEVVRGLEKRRPLVITLNGKPAAVMMSPKEYDRIAYRERVVASINEGLRDLAEGRTYSHEEVGKMLDARFRITPMRAAATPKTPKKKSR